VGARKLLHIRVTVAPLGPLRTRVGADSSELRHARRRGQAAPLRDQTATGALIAG
jgi:hypothetical protein